MKYLFKKINKLEKDLSEYMNLADIFATEEDFRIYHRDWLEDICSHCDNTLSESESDCMLDHKIEKNNFICYPCFMGSINKIDDDYCK